MIVGIGTDIQDIPRIESLLSSFGERFLDKFLTQREKEYCLNKGYSSHSIAGRWAAKEAAHKALTGNVKEMIPFTEMEIMRDEKGKPVIYFPNNNLPKGLTSSLSISHSGGYATAVCIIENKNLGDL
tara:strand:- start:584 stop:964 length:381 start_codon:yes stop_codon:yes gene_type:complete